MLISSKKGNFKKNKEWPFSPHFQITCPYQVIRTIRLPAQVCGIFNRRGDLAPRTGSDSSGWRPGQESVERSLALGREDTWLKALLDCWHRMQSKLFLYSICFIQILTRWQTLPLCSQQPHAGQRTPALKTDWLAQGWHTPHRLGATRGEEILSSCQLLALLLLLALVHVHC